MTKLLSNYREQHLLSESELGVDTNDSWVRQIDVDVAGQFRTRVNAGAARTYSRRHREAEPEITGRNSRVCATGNNRVIVKDITDEELQIPGSSLNSETQIGQAVGRKLHDIESLDEAAVLITIVHFAVPFCAGVEQVVGIGQVDQPGVARGALEFVAIEAHDAAQIVGITAGQLCEFLTLLARVTRVDAAYIA